MRAFSSLLALFLLLAATYPVAVLAGKRMDYHVVQNAGEERISLYLEGSQARIVSSANQQSALIFSSDARQIHILDHLNKSVTTIDQQSLEQLASISRELGEVAQAQGGVLGDIFETFGFDNHLGEAAQIEVRTLSGSRSFSGQRCQMQQVYKDGKLNTQLCLTDKLKLSARERATLESLLNFAQLMVRQGQVVLQQFSLPIPLLPDETLQGMPIYVDDVESSTSATLIGLKEIKLAAQQFSLPEGYTRRVLSL